MLIILANMKIVPIVEGLEMEKEQKCRMALLIWPHITLLGV